MDGVNSKLLKDVIKHREFINNDEWGLFRGKVGLIRYQRLIKSIASLNMGWVDAKVSIDSKRILRLPSSLHSMVSMKCMEVNNLDNFDRFRDAVPCFVYERK